MAFKFQDVPEDMLFGRKLVSLVEENGYTCVREIAEAIYNDEPCFFILKPEGHRTKFEKEKYIDAFTKSIIRHFNTKYAYNVSSSYLLVYSTIFHTSLDFLFGKIDVSYPDLEIKDISEKTGLSVQAIRNLEWKGDVWLQEHLHTAHEYSLLTLPIFRSRHDKKEIDYVDVFQPISNFWSELLESELFFQLPENWFRMACALYTNKGMKIIAEDSKKKWDEEKIPELDEFLKIMNSFDRRYPTIDTMGPLNSSWEEDYATEDSTYIRETYNEARAWLNFPCAEKAEECETVFWGCAGRFERALLNFFSEKAEEWCKTGPLPPIKE